MSGPDNKPAGGLAEMADEQRAEFDALSAGAAEPAPDAPPGGAGVPADVSLSAELSGLMSALLVVVGPMFPSVGAIYTPEVIAAASGSLGAVCVKHGWLSGGVMGGYAEEMAAVMVCGPLALATVSAVKSDLARAKNAQAGAVIAAPVTPAGAVSGGEVGAAPVVDETKPYVLARG